MQAEVAELALLLGAAIQHSQDLSARSLLQGAAHNLFQVQPVRQACSHLKPCVVQLECCRESLSLREVHFNSLLVAVV